MKKIALFLVLLFLLFAVPSPVVAVDYDYHVAPQSDCEAMLAKIDDLMGFDGTGHTKTYAKCRKHEKANLWMFPLKYDSRPGHGIYAPKLGEVLTESHIYEISTMVEQEQRENRSTLIAEGAFPAGP